MTSKAAEVAVVVPTSNRRELLRKNALHSALSQQDVRLEVIVIDDGSSDGTAEDIAELDDPRVRLVRHVTRRGPSAARNTGIGAARSEWIALLDDDDLWSPRKLRVQLDAATAADAWWVYAASAVVDPDGTILSMPPLASVDSLAETLESGNVLWGGNSNVVARTELLRALGGFDETLAFFEDWDLWLRLARAAPAASCADVLVATVEHRERTLFRSDADVMEQFERMLSKHRPVTRRDRLTVTEWLAEEHALIDERRRAARLYLSAALRFGSPGNLAPALAALFGRRALSLLARAQLAVAGRTHLARIGRSSPGAETEVPWLVAGKASG